MLEISIILGILNLILIVYLVLKQAKSSSKEQSNNLTQEDKEYLFGLVSDLNDKLYQKLDQFKDRVVEILNINQNSINQELNKISNSLEANQKEFLGSSQNYFKESQNQQTQSFQKLELKNQEQLNKLQTSIQERLEKSVLNLIQINKAQLEKIQESTNKNFELLSQTNKEKLNQINSDVQKRLDENFAQNLKSFKEVTQNLGHIQSSAQKMVESTKSVDRLNQIFARTSSKSFGDFGEKYLETMLRENLASESWQKQVTVPGSLDKLDFLISLDDKKIGIDCKFPLTRYQDYLEAENSEKATKLKEYLQSVLQMAKSINQKYTKHGFVDVLFLYLPSDSMYSEASSNDSLMKNLQTLKVTLCSPSTIFPLLIIINQYQFKIQVGQRAEKIVEGLKNISQNIAGFREEFRKLGDKIRLAQSNYDQADKNLTGVERNILLLENKDSDLDG